MGPQPLPGNQRKNSSSAVKLLEAIAKPYFIVIPNEVKDLQPIKFEILRFAQNDIFRQNGGLE
jgi:hypothetical protein